MSEVYVWTVPLAEGTKAERRVAAGVALRSVLAREAGPGFELVEGTGGKPALAGAELEFNLSHSGSLALVAVSRWGPVGVDVEQRRVLRDPAGLARRICSPRELLAARDGADVEQLLRWWVRKEAVAKATGHGLSALLNGIDVLDETVDGSWRVLDLPLPDGYLGAVAVPVGVAGFELRSFQADFH